MKNLKTILAVAMIAVFSFALTGCGDPDPEPEPTESSLDLVKAELTGTWTFVSVTVSIDSKSATTSTCEKTELTNASFPNTDWQTITPEPNLIYSGTNTVGYNLPCLTGSPTDNVSWTAVENPDKTVTVSLSNGRKFLVDVDDIKATTIKANLINDAGYLVRYEFQK